MTITWMFLGLLGCQDDPGSKPLPTCALEAPEPGVLRVEGTQVLDEMDRLVTWRGINTGGRSKYAPYSPFPWEEGGFQEALDAYLDRTLDWGFDLLRVPFSWAAAEPEQGRWDSEWLDRYDALLDAAWARGMWTIVDFHQDVYAEAFCGDGFPHWTLPADPGEARHDCPGWFTNYVLNDDVRQAFDWFWQDTYGARTAFGEMWDMMVARHADRPGVVGFEIINEPSGGTMPSADWEVEVLSPFYTEMAARIQGADPDALVFFDATGLQSAIAHVSLPKPEGDNLVFAPHFYDFGALFGGELNTDIAAGLGDWAAQGEEWDLPVMIGEFGIRADHDEVESHARVHYDAFDDLGLHGTWWEYSDSVDLWNEEDLSVLGPDGEEREAMLNGLVRPYARALAGSSPELVYDAETRVLELSFDAELEGITEVVLPARIYEGEVTVTGEGACVDHAGDRLLVKAEATRVFVRVSP
jgi:endoglycosylceramidase